MEKRQENFSAQHMNLIEQHAMPPFDDCHVHTWVWVYLFMNISINTNLILLFELFFAIIFIEKENSTFLFIEELRNNSTMLL